MIKILTNVLISFIIISIKCYSSMINKFFLKKENFLFYLIFKCFLIFFTKIIKIIIFIIK